MSTTTRAGPGGSAPEGPFRCHVLGSDVTLTDCVEDYEDAMSRDQRGSACFECPHGQRNRLERASVDGGD